MPDPEHGGTAIIYFALHDDGTVHVWTYDDIVNDAAVPVYDHPANAQYAREHVARLRDAINAELDPGGELHGLPGDAAEPDPAAVLAALARYACHLGDIPVRDNALIHRAAGYR